MLVPLRLRWLCADGDRDAEVLREGPGGLLLHGWEGLPVPVGLPPGEVVGEVVVAFELLVDSPGGGDRVEAPALRLSQG